VLEGANRAYVEAKSALENSKKRQLQLSLEVKKAEDALAEITPETVAIATESYRNGRIGAIGTLLNSGSPESFLERAVTLNEWTWRNDKRLKRMNEALAQVSRAKAALDAEIREEQKQLKVMARQKKEAEKALKLAGATATGGGWVYATSPVARAAPRNSDGSWPGQSCTIDDPTTSGCITPRTLHAYKETKRAGFNLFVSCYRPGGPYEHPKGRACDWSMQKRGFGGDATGDGRFYGNNLAAFLVRNADQLGILYVIWYRMFWSPATGWVGYTGAYGDPSSDHTNHVHMSMI
jgi:hypothetical protein